MLEAIAENEFLRKHTLRRFERDEPPPYVSSTESSDIDEDDRKPLQEGPALEELRAVMDRPIDDEEVRDIALALESLATPGDFYHSEVWREEHRLNAYRPAKVKIFRGNKGIRRLGVMARHNVKRRWEKLGIWNPEWGFPGRNLRPGDKITKWKWRWEQHDADDSESGNVPATTSTQLVTRAVRQRQKLRRGENAPVIPCSHLKQDVTAAEAESFLISRPWFVFRLELEEEETRIRRLSPFDEGRLPRTERGQVIERWNERGDWREEFNETGLVDSWKWRHESPSPEPEDLSPLDKMKDSPLDNTDIDLTPSEIDDLETIELPNSKQPENYWEILSEYGISFPGQRLDLSRKAEKVLRKRTEEAQRDRTPPILPPSPKGWRDSLPRTHSPEQEASQKENEDTVQKLEDNPSKAQQDTSSVAIPKPIPNSPRQHRRQFRDQVLRSQDPDPGLNKPRLRRSARIAATKRLAEPLRSQTGPKKKRRLRKPPNVEALAGIQPVSPGDPTYEDKTCLRSPVTKGGDRV